MTNQEAAKLVAICLAMWPNHKVPDAAALVRGWELGLSGVAYPDAEAALTEYLQTGTFFPTPAEIRKLVRVRVPDQTPMEQRWIYRIWSAAADRYVELPEPVPYREELHGSAARVRRFAGEVLPGDPAPLALATGGAA